MNNIISMIGSYWWIGLVLLAVVGYKLIFRLFGIVIIPEDKIGLVTKKFVLFGTDKELPDGRIIATKGEAGFQAKSLAPGIYFWMWPWQFEVDMQGFIVVPEGKIGLISSKDGIVPQTGRILGRRIESDNYQDSEKFLTNGGQKGRQSAYLVSGSYRINTHLFEVHITDQIHINDNMVGVVTTLDGEPLDEGQIAANELNGKHNKFQDFDAFLSSGGQRGLQQQVILAGTYNINPWAVNIEEVRMTEIPIGFVGVVVSYVGADGKDLTGVGFKHGNIVAKGEKGVCIEPLGPGKYPINTFTHRIELVPTTNLVLNWANARNESHQLDKNLSTITVRSKDGFPFNLDVSQIIHIPMMDAPRVIARFGAMQNLVSQVLEPTIGNYFRNSAQDSDVISFLSSRKERQESAKQHISAVLEEYNVHAVDTLIGDITPPESLMKTLTDRKIAEEQKVTYETQRKAQIERQSFEKENAIADMQKDVVKADQSVLIADKTAQASIKESEGAARSIELRAKADSEATKLKANAEAERITVTGDAEAGKTLAIGKSNAEAYKLAVTAMGEENFTRLKVTESIGQNHIKVTPDILITSGSGNGSNSSPMEGLLAYNLVQQIDGASKEKKAEEVKKTEEDSSKEKKK